MTISLLVVPAWKGWEVIQLFLRSVTGAIGDKNAWHFAGASVPFTYTAGVVFCNKRPRSIRCGTLPKTLLIEGKKKSG